MLTILFILLASTIAQSNIYATGELYDKNQEHEVTPGYLLWMACDLQYAVGWCTP